jgi:hypothetical protein
MPTLNEHAQTLKQMQEDPASLGYSAREVRSILFDYQRHLGSALVDRIDKMLPFLGDEVIDDDWLAESVLAIRQTSERVEAPETFAPYPMIAALDQAIAEGNRGIMLADKYKSVQDSLETIEWAVKRSGNVVVVGASFMISEIHIRYHDVLPPNLLIVDPISAEKRLKADHLHLGNPSTVLFLKPFPQQHELLSTFAERVRDEHPDAVVVYERGFGGLREMPGTDMFLRLTGSSVAMEPVPQPAPGL